MIYQKLRHYLEQFVSLTDEEFGFLKPQLVIRTYRKKDFLIRQGEQEDHIYFLVEGLIHQYFYKGKEMVSTEFMDEGSVTGGVVSFFSARPSYYFVQALEDSTVIGLSRQTLDSLYLSDRKWEQLGRMIIASNLIRQEREIIDTIRLSMRERYVQFAKEHPELLKRVPQRRIASYLNIKPETYSRLKPLLEND